MDTAYQRKGVGSKLVKEIEKRIRKRGATNICAIINAKNKSVKGLLGRFGFKVFDQAFAAKRLGR